MVIGDGYYEVFTHEGPDFRPSISKSHQRFVPLTDGSVSVLVVPELCSNMVYSQDFLLLEKDA